MGILVGNKRVKEILKKDIDEGRIASSYLFTGPSGVGKKEFAFWFAKMLHCESRGEENPCNRCKSCSDIDKGVHSEVFYIAPLIDEKKKLVVPTLKIDEINDFVVKNSNFKSWYNGWRIFIIDEAESLTEEASNVLLKTLEEPPEKVVIILITDSPGKLLSTIVSRCRVIEFDYLKKEEVEAFLKDSLWEEENIRKYIENFDGTISWILKLKEVGIDKLNDLYYKIELFRIEKDWGNFFDLLSRIVKGEEFEKKFLTTFFKFILRKKELAMREGKISPVEFEDILNIAELVNRQRDPEIILTRIFL